MDGYWAIKSPTASSRHRDRLTNGQGGRTVAATDTGTGYQMVRGGGQWQLQTQGQANKWSGGRTVAAPDTGTG